MKLKEAYRIILWEWNFQTKRKFESGTRKMVYPLKTHPEFVIKKIIDLDNIGKRILNKEIKFQKKFPNLFAEIVKVNYEKGWIIQERLETKRFIEEFDIFYTSVCSFISINKIEVENSFENLLDELLDLFEIDSIKEKYLIPSSFSFKLYHFMQDLVATNTYIDFTEFNCGFDKNGNIKLLDL